MESTAYHVVPCGQNNYLMAHMLLARYWGKHQVEGLFWLLRAFGGRSASHSVPYCSRCKRACYPRGYTQLGITLCPQCMTEFMVLKGVTV